MDELNPQANLSPQEAPSAEPAVPPAPELADNGDLSDSDAENKAWGVAIAGWLVPGLGHALQKMWGRALVVFLTVGCLVATGALMRGNLFTARGSDAFDALGYVADLGTGIFYFLARSLERHGADVSHAGGDYGTRFLATAGVLNLLAALHAFEAARGRKA